MDEMKALTRFRGQLAYADPAVLARTRSRLLDLADGRRPPGRRWSRPPGRRLAVAAAVTALAVTGVIGADSLVVGGRPVGASAEAADLLHRAADAAIVAADPEVGPDEYLRVATVAVYRSASVQAGESEWDAYYWLSTYTEDLFVPGDPDAEWVLRRSPRVPYRPADVETAQRAGVAETPGFTERAPGGAFFGTEVVGTWLSPTPEFLAGLPTGARDLLDRIYRDSAGGGQSRDGEALVYIADVLRSGIVPADLRAALFRAAALIPGVEVTDRRANLDGRTGVAVGRYEAVTGTRTEIIFAPETGALIGERDVLVDRSYGPTLPAGSTVAWTAVSVAVVPAAEVDAIPAQPRPGD